MQFYYVTNPRIRRSNFSYNTEVIMELFYILNERAGCRITDSMWLTEPNSVVSIN
jgi:hypothetical protein